MNLHRTVINEQLGVATYSLMLQRIISAGKITDFSQTYILSYLSEFFKDASGNIQNMEIPVPYGNGATSTEVISYIKGLPDSEAVNLAQFILDMLNNARQNIRHTALDANQWIDFVLRRQD